MTSTGTHFFWITSRAAGSSALVLSSLSVCAGLLIGRRFAGAGGLGRDGRHVHEALSLATLAAIAVHGLSLLGDTFFSMTPIDIAIPFVGPYRPFWTGLGIAGGWLLALLGLSYYARAKIGVTRWRSLHRLTAVAWLLGLVHSLGAGTDAGTRWFLAMTGAVVLPALALLAMRMSGAETSASTTSPGAV